MTVLLDNKGQGKVGDALAAGIQANARLSILSSLFSVYGYSALKKQLDRAGLLRILIPSNDAHISSGSGQSFRVAGLTGSESDRRFRNSLNLAEIARECTEWLHQKAEINGIQLPEDVAVFLGNYISSNIRELEGALIHLMAFCSVNRRELTVEAARQIAQERGQGNASHLSIEAIQKQVAEHFDLTPDLLVGKTRKQEIANARQIAMFLSKRLTKNPLRIIGLHFGNRDHSTVVHAVQTVEKKCKRDLSFAQMVESLEEIIQQKHPPRP